VTGAGRGRDLGAGLCRKICFVLKSLTHQFRLERCHPVKVITCDLTVGRAGS